MISLNGTKMITMKSIFVIFASLILVSCGQDLKPQLEKLEKENEILREMAGPLPASLDEYYPPKSPAPKYLIDMFSMATPLMGIAADLQENDKVGAMANFDAFKSNYLKSRMLVEEWMEMFPLDVLDSLGLAISEYNPSKIGKAMALVGNSCTSCHLINQIKVQQKFHWPDFEILTINDPVSGGSLSWHDYMMNISVAFSGISTSLIQGQLENARRNFQKFSDQFSALGESCYGCHNTPRAYYTDESVKNLISNLGNKLAISSPDQNVIQQMVGEIGNEGCVKCHYLHMPSSFAKMNFKKFEEIITNP